MGVGFTDEWPQYRNDIPYSNESRLNTIQTCIPRPTSAHDQKRLWVIYVHGGAWSDPKQSASTFDKAQHVLLQSPLSEHVAGFASINYRLSPRPWDASDPSNPGDPARNAQHPDHINDVLAAILTLQETYRFEDRYILVGHSCGASLVFQVAMKRYWGSQYESTPALELNVVPPRAICAIEGLYDLPALVQYHHAQPVYHNFVEAAFGPNKSQWSLASPVHGDYNDSWPDGELVVLAHSHADELVEWEQSELMRNALSLQGFEDSGARKLKLLELKGTHDQVWEEGAEVARAIEYTIQELVDPK
jgi:acetyl esterase/lipase